MKKKITKASFHTIPIENDGLHIMIPVKVNNRKANMLIDTGASRTVFDKSSIQKFLDAQDAKPEQNEMLSTGIGTTKLESQVVALDKLKIGGLVIKEYKAVVIEMSHVNESYAKLNIPRIDGVIGGDILGNYLAVINYKEKFLKLYY